MAEKKEEQRKAKASNHTMFGSSVVVTDWNPALDADWNKDFAMELYRMRTQDPDGIYRSNAGGTWHSKDTVLTATGEYGEKLADMFRQVFIQQLEYAFALKKGGRYKLRMGAWAMMYRDRGYAAVHTHPNCHLSGVYYIDAGKPVEAKQLATGVKVLPGTIEFIDTRYGTGLLQIPGLSFNPSCRLPAKAGHMITFPSGLPHMVHPYEGEGERIAVACNATIVEYEQPKE